MQSGTNDDLPKTLLEPMSLEDRCAVLKGLLDDIKDNGGISDNLMLKQNLLKLTFSCNQSIHYVAKGAMISYVHPEYDNVYIYINEEYISNAVKMFLKYLDKSRLAYSQIETISYLTNLLEEFQRKGEVDND